MNAESPESAPAQIELPLCNVGIVLTKAMDQLLMDTIRTMSLEEEYLSRADLSAMIIPIIKNGKRKANDLPLSQKPACILLDGELRMLTGIFEVMLMEESQPARSMIFELLVLLMGNGWRRAEHLNAVRV